MPDPLPRIWPNDDLDYHIVVYNGYGSPAHVITCPREVEYIVRPVWCSPKPSACVWIVCTYDR